jgi:metallophosphoesterase superfamily enzyme
LILPVFDAPLLLVEGDERVLVAADLHLGLEYELWLGGVSIPSQTEKILAALQGFLAEIKPDRLLLLGDIKHNVPKTSWQEKREIPEFLRRLCARAKVEIVPGNHDSNLADMAPLVYGCARPPALCWTVWAISTATPGRMKRLCARTAWWLATFTPR